jgi:hypothetical protein
MTTTTATLQGAPVFVHRNAAKLSSALAGNSVDLVTLGEIRSTLPNVPRQFHALQQMAAAPPPGDAAKAAANHFRDLWAKALQDNPDGPQDARFDHAKFLDPDYLKSITFHGHALIVPGDAAGSYLPQMISGANGAKQMPPDGDISDADRTALLSAANDWINQKAVNWGPLPTPSKS